MNDQNFKARKVINDLSDKLFSHYTLCDNSYLDNYFSLDTPFVYNGVALGLCLNGHANIQIGHHECKVLPGAILSVLPGQVVITKKYSDDFFIDVIFLSFDFIENLSFPRNFDLFRCLYEHPSFLVSPGVFDDLCGLYRILVQYNISVYYYKKEIFSALTSAFVSVFASVYHNKFSSSYEQEQKYPRSDEMTYRFFSLLGKEYIRYREISFYADSLCVTPKYLSSAIHKVTGRNASDWIVMTVVIDMKQRLGNTKYSITQISEMMNFPDTSSFSRYFKRYVGCSPMQYRKSCLNN